MDYIGCGSDYFSLMPLILRVQQLPLVVRNERPLLDQHCERLLISFEDLDLEIVREGLLI